MKRILQNIDTYRMIVYRQIYKNDTFLSKTKQSPLVSLQKKNNSTFTLYFTSYILQTILFEKFVKKSIKLCKKHYFFHTFTLLDFLYT